MPQFISMFDVLDISLAQRFKWTAFSPQAKAIIAVVGLLLVTFSLGAAAVFTTHSLIPLLILGVVYGVILSYPLTKFFGPKIQSLVTGFLGGVSLGNIGTQEAKLRAWIIALGNSIKQLVASAHPPEGLSDAIVYSIWTAIIVAFFILAANAYFANQKTNPVGNPIPPPLPAPAIVAAAVAGPNKIVPNP